MIKKINGEYPAEEKPQRDSEEYFHLIEDAAGALSHAEGRTVPLLVIIRELREKANKYDAYVRELRSAPLRKNQ
jgi:hypothetical protein